MTSFSPPPFPPATIAKRRRKIPFGTRQENYCTVRRRLLIAVYVCRRAGRTQRREKQRISSYFFSKNSPPSLANAARVSLSQQKRGIVCVRVLQLNRRCAVLPQQPPTKITSATASKGGGSMSGGGVRCLNPLFLPSSLDVISWKEK